MTLSELLVSIMVIGSIVAVLAATVTVTFRQQGDTQGRFDVARWGQSLAMWLPSDIASATAVSDDESKAPCASAECTFGSNALELKWDDGTGETTLSYRYGPAGDGTSFILTRVECKGGVCVSRVVLRDLSAPLDDDGNPRPWESGDPVPDEVIDVTLPLEVLASDPPTTVLPGSTLAQRVIVNVNGAPGVDGVDRSSSVSFTAGGSSFGPLAPPTFSGPTFLGANSGCGGPITLIVDESGSIGSSNMGKVRTGVRSFVDAFEGTPTRLQIITFDTKSATLGSVSGSWNRFFDLSEPSDVELLMGPTGTSGLVSSLSSGGGTNWEDALHRAFYSENGQTYDQLGNPSAPTPELVVFFTDGVPTFDRIGSGSYTGSTVKSDTSSVGPSTIPSRFNYTTDGGSGSYGNAFSPRGWYRADYILDQFRSHDPPIRLIGVGVGDAFSQSTRVYRSGWPGPTTSPYQIPNEAFVGDVLTGGDPSQYVASEAPGYLKQVWSLSSGWGDVSQADLLVTSDWNQFGGALIAIALADCGGTLTVQTRDQANAPADATIIYQVGAETVTTTRIAKAGTFDIPLAGVASADVVLLPQSLDGTGYTAQAWECRAGGADLVVGTDYVLIEPGNPMAGIEVTVSANAAVSCTLRVTP
jgi:hypothetical protein